MPGDDSLTSFRDAARTFSELRIGERGSRTAPMYDDASAAPALPPEYRLEALIAETRLSRTWRAFHTEHQAHIVVKELHPRLLLEREALERFRLEVQPISKFAPLAHRNIVPVLATHLAEPPYFFSMPLIEGEHLDVYCTTHGLDVRQRVELFLRVCRGVAHAHRAGVVHRDLKPNNIIVDRDGEPQLLDFGLARVHLDADAGDASRCGPIYGALAYMAPEQTEGLPGDVATDIYALGGILYELLTGKRPIELASTMDEHVARIRTATPVPPRSRAPSISPELEAVVLRCLEKRPADRYQSVSELSTDLQCCLADRPISLWRTRGRYVLTKFLRRNRVRTAIAVALALALVTLLGFEISRQQQLALTHLRAETERHMRAIAHARLLTSRDSPAAAAALLRNELAEHDNLRTRFALWELHRGFPCIAHLASKQSLAAVVFAGNRWLVAVDQDGVLHAHRTDADVDEWARLPLELEATCVAPGQGAAAFYVGTAAGAVYAVEHANDAAPPARARLIVAPDESSEPLTRIAVSAHENHAAFATRSGRFILAAASTGGRTTVVAESTFFERVTSLAFSLDGRLLAAAGQPIGLLPTIGVVKILDTERGDERRARAVGQVRTVAFAPNGRTLYVGDEAVQAWHLADDTVERLWDDLKWGIRSVVVSPAGPHCWLACAGGDGRLRFAGTGEPFSWPIQGFHETIVADDVRIVASPDGHLAASVAHDGVRLWDVYPTRRLPVGPTGEADWRPTGVMLDDQADSVVVASNRAREGDSLGDSERALSVGPAAGPLRTIVRTDAHSPIDCCVLAGRMVAYAFLNPDGDQHAVAVIDLDAPEHAPCIAMAPARVVSLAWLDVARGHLLAGLHDGRIVLFRYDRAAGIAVLVATLAAFDESVECNAITPSADRRWLAATAERTQEVGLWGVDTVGRGPAGNLPTLQLQRRIRVDFLPWQVAILGDTARPLLAVSGAAQDVAIIDGVTGQQYGRLVGHCDSIDGCVALSADVLLTASRDGDVIAWDARNLEELAVLHTGAPSCPRIAVANSRIAIATDAGVTIADLRECFNAPSAGTRPALAGGKSPPALSDLRRHDNVTSSRGHGWRP